MSERIATSRFVLSLRASNRPSARISYGENIYPGGPGFSALLVRGLQRLSPQTRRSQRQHPWRQPFLPWLRRWDIKRGDKFLRAWLQRSVAGGDDAFRFDHQDRRPLRRTSPMKHASRNRKPLARLQFHDLVFEIDKERSFHDIKELVFLVMLVPMEL